MKDTAKTKAQLANELHALREQLAAKDTEIGLREQQLSAMFDGIDEVVYVADPDTHELLFMNRAMSEAFNATEGDICFKALQGRDSPCPFCSNSKIFGDYLGQSYIWEFQNEKNGNWYRCIDKAIPWPDDRMVRYEMAIDVTSLKAAEEKIARQAREILDLSTPVIQIWKGVLVAPLIGAFENERVQQFNEVFLEQIVRTRSEIALLDITGVPAIDTSTAQSFIETISGARLLGTSVILTGVRPAIAQSLVQLGIDLGDVETRSSLAEGIRLAFDRQQLMVTRKGATAGGAAISRPI